MHPSNLANHAQHDLELIAASIDSDLTGTERAAADALLAGCASCADLRRDLVAVASAARALPRTMTAARDFRLDAAQAARLRQGGVLRRLLRPFAAPRSAARPMAAAFTTLGLAGLLVANILPGLIGSAASGGARMSDSHGPAPAASAAAAGTNVPVAVPVAGQPGATTTGRDGNEYQVAQSSPPTDQNVKAESAASNPPRDLAGGGQGTTLDQAGTGASEPTVQPQPNVLLLGSLLLLAIGLCLFGILFAARRTR